MQRQVTTHDSTNPIKEIMTPVNIAPIAPVTPISASLLSKLSLIARLGISARTIENMIKAKKFPPGVRIGKFAYWTEDAVQKWQSRAFGVQQGWQP